MAEIAVRLLLNAVKDVAWESIALTGVRTEGRRASWTIDAEGEEIPEMELNLRLLAEAFLQLVASGLGALALVWATVVLLGGFSTMLVRKDFWFTTAIVFIETARIVGYNSGPEARFFVDVLSDFSQKNISRFRSLTDSVCILREVPLAIALAPFFAAGSIILSTLAPIFAAAGCIILSIMRILPIARHGKYGGSSSDSSNDNIKAALLLFYALVLTQGSLFIMWFAVAVDRSELTEKLSKRYFGNSHLSEGRKLINRYVAATVDKCMEKGVVGTMNRTLVSFAAELLESEVSADHLCAVSVLQAVITRKERTAGAVQQLCASKESVGKLFQILSSEESLFNQEIIVPGLLILAKLAKNPKNAKKIYENKGLVSRITAPISNELYQVLKDDAAIEITGKSLLVLSKIISGTNVPQEICNSGLGPNTIHLILLTDDLEYNKLKVPAIKMLTKLILTSPSRDYNTIVDFISVLMKLFFTDANDSILRKTAGKALALLSMEDSKIFRDMVVKGNTGTEDSVVQKLTKMLSDSSNKLNRASIAKLLMQFCAVLRSEEARQHLEAVKTTILHEVLKTICNVEEEGSPVHVASVFAGFESGTVSEILLYFSKRLFLGHETSANQSNKTGCNSGRRKTLVAVLGLAVQMCECDQLLDASDLDAALKEIFSSKAEVVADKLKEVIEICNKESVALLKGKGPSADYLAIIKSVTKLCAWVVRTKPDYRVHFQKNNTAEKLKEADGAMRELEMAVVLSSSADENANYKTLGSIVRDALECIPPQHDNEDRCWCSCLCVGV